ncbi:hypothetical protein X975_00468, partial [Stegodyphus mimosarum]
MSETLNKKSKIQSKRRNIFPSWRHLLQRLFPAQPNSNSYNRHPEDIE